MAAMKSKALLVCLLALLELCSITFTRGINPKTRQLNYEEKYFDQFVDHFNFVSFGNVTYKQRYLINDQSWLKGKGPIFFYTGNEGDIVNFWKNSGFVLEIAPKFKALVVFAEHRYYGVSLPFGKDSFQQKFIGLLTSEQAIADYAILLNYLKNSLGATKCPVIAFGGSYGGMLSAYMRAKYPHIIDGALAASAPVYMGTPGFPRDFFFSHVTKDFRNIDPQCEVGVRSAFRDLADLAAQGSSGLATISSNFKLCQPLRNESDYRHFLLWIRNAFVELAMFDYPYPTTFTETLPGNPVQVACSKILEATTSIKGLLNATEMVYGSVKCHDIWTDYIECADPTGCGLGTDSLAWDFQACTELALPAGTDNITDMFPELPFTLPQRIEYCKKQWGVIPRDDWISTQMFTIGLKGASNIIFSNGKLDPWMGGGVLSSISDSLVAIVIDGGAHHLDLRGSNPSDPASVIKARQLEVQYINKWINQSKKFRIK